MAHNRSYFHRGLNFLIQINFNVFAEMELREDGADDDIIWTSNTFQKVIFRFVFSEDDHF